MGETENASATNERERETRRDERERSGRAGIMMQTTSIIGGGGAAMTRTRTRATTRTRAGAGSSRLATKAMLVRPYTVRKGDTVFKISQKRDVKIEDILSVNHGLRKEKIQEGQTILLPSSKLSERDREILDGVKGWGKYRAYPVRKGECIEDIIESDDEGEGRGWPESLHGRAERTEERTPVQFFSSYRVFFFKQKDSYYTKECIMLIQFYSYTQ